MYVQPSITRMLVQPYNQHESDRVSCTPEVIDAAIVFEDDELVCARLIDISTDNLHTISNDKLILCGQKCEKLKSNSPVSQSLRLSITRCLVRIITLRTDIERWARTDFVIEHLILNRSRDIRNCIPMAELDIEFDRFMLIFDERLISLISRNVSFKKDLFETIVCIGLANWPMNVTTAMVMAIKYIPGCVKAVEEMVSKPAKSVKLSRALFDVVGMKCQKLKIENKARLEYGPIDNLDKILLAKDERNYKSQHFQCFNHLLHTLCGHFFKIHKTSSEQIRDEIEKMPIRCNVTKLLATLIISTPLPYSNLEYVPFLTEAVEMFLNETTNQRFTPLCKDVISTFMLPGKREDFIFPVNKTKGWYSIDMWGNNLRALTVATLLAPRGLAMWFGADTACKLLFILDSNLMSSRYIRNKVDITDITKNLSQLDQPFSFLSAFVRITSGPGSVWSIIANLNHTSLYFICPLIMNEDLSLALEVLRCMSNGFPSTILLTEFVLFLTINNPAFTILSTKYAKSALHNEMPKSALQLLERTTASVDHVLAFEIFQSLDFAEDCRAICMKMDVSEGYERTKMVRQRAKQALSQWAKETDKAKSSFVTSFEHLLLSNDNKQCCKVFSKAGNPLSNEDIVENFTHNLIHDRIMTSIGNDLNTEVFKIRLLNKWASIKGETSQCSVFHHTLNIVNKFADENIELIIDEFQGHQWTNRMASFFRILDLYKHGEQEIAFSYLKLLLESSVDDFQIPMLDTLVQWSEIGNFENWHSMITIIKAHVKLADETGLIQQSDNTHKDIHGILSDFMYNRYTDRLAYINCAEFRDKQQSVMSSENDLLHMKSGKYMKLLTAYTKTDRNDVERTLNEFSKLIFETLMCLIKHLRKNWTSTDQMTLTVLQLVNVLFCKGTSFVRAEKGYSQVISELETLPAGVFLPVARQLTAKISEKTSFVNRIVSKMLIEYPFEIIPLLLCMENDESRRTIIHNILTENKENTEEIWQYRRLFSFYKSIALCKNSRSLIPPKCLIELGVIDRIRLPTDDDTKASISVTKFYPDIEYLPGITCPKIISCRTSDGRKLRQIIKSGDDLRQDALIQQTFKAVNSLMFHRRQIMSSVYAKSQSVGPGFELRCYGVCPVTNTCGVLSYCEDTISFGSYLADPRHGAHVTYGTKNEYSCEKCRDILQKYSNKSKPDTLKVYTDICMNLKPVMRHFFYERFPEPWLWVDYVRQYTRSVACSSIAGYMLGLGDRHPNNILLDQTNGDVIHIDFGIAFEQGKILPVPEVVPFRLTRDVVDGFGRAGPDGLFRSAAVECMLTLVQNKSLVLSIVNVLVDDPLCNWTIDISKKCKFQPPQNSFELFVGQDKKEKTDIEVDHVSHKRNKLVERALARIREKLSIENTNQAVSNRMNELINEATNPENLCRMYHGWQPYL